MTEDQTLLQDAAERYLRENYDFNKRRENITQGIYRDPEQWQAFADMGWLALPYPESLGGLEMGSRELAILAELCGRYLVTEPLIDSLAITSKVIAASDQAPDLVPAIAAGEIVPIACIDEMAGSRSVAPATRLERVESGWRLKGEKPWVSAGASATHFVVLASGADGLAWVVVASDAEGVQSDHFATHDGRGGTNCRFDIAINDAEICSRASSPNWRWKPIANWPWRSAVPRRWARRRPHSTPPLITPNSACNLASRWLHFRHFSTAWQTCSYRLS